MFYLSSELFTGCPSMHVSSISCQHCHSFFSDTAPVYLSDLLRVYSPSTQLHFSSHSRILRIPPIETKTFGHRSFSYAAPSVWNSLPREIRHIRSATAFKTSLKTHLFKSYFCRLNLYSLHLFLWITSFDLLCGVCLCVWVCVCERERERDVGCIFWRTIHGWACYCSCAVLAFLLFFSLYSAPRSGIY